MTRTLSRGLCPVLLSLILNQCAPETSESRTGAVVSNSGGSSQNTVGSASGGAPANLNGSSGGSASDAVGGSSVSSVGGAPGAQSGGLSAIASGGSSQLAQAGSAGAVGSQVNADGSLTPKSTFSLFNGVDLTGWFADVPDKDTDPTLPDSFIVRNGLLVSRGTAIGHLLTRATYRDYRLEVEYRFSAGEGNCGVLIHSSDLRALYGAFPKSIEVQLFSGDAGDFWCIQENIEVPNMDARRLHESVHAIFVRASTQISSGLGGKVCLSASDIISELSRRARKTLRSCRFEACASLSHLIQQLVPILRYSVRGLR